MQNKPNLLLAKINTTAFKTRDYKKKRACRCGKNKPKQTQFMPNLVPWVANFARFTQKCPKSVRKDEKIGKNDQQCEKLPKFSKKCKKN